MRTLIPRHYPVLRQAARDIPIDEIPGPRTQDLIRDMQNILKKEPLGVAIAAPQVGEGVRLFIVAGSMLVADPESEDPKKQTTPPPPDLVCINPDITRMSRKRKHMHEGCLSMPGYWGTVLRAEKVTLTAYDEHGKKFTRGASGILAQIFQHEIDHLNGVLYTDKAVQVYKEENEKRDDL